MTVVMGEQVWPKSAGNGGLEQATADGLYVNATGDTMTGTLIISTAPDPTWLDLDSDAARDRIIRIKAATVMRWSFGAKGSTEDFLITRWADNGSWVDDPIKIGRATGLVTVKGDPTVPLGVATKQYADARTPKIWLGDTDPVAFGAVDGDVWIGGA